MNVVTDEYIEHLFAGCNFGEAVNSSIVAKRDFLRCSLENQLNGYWCGSTIYAIMTTGGFLIDSKPGSVKRLTALGVAFLDTCKHEFVFIKNVAKKEDGFKEVTGAPISPELNRSIGRLYSCSICGKVIVK